MRQLKPWLLVLAVTLGCGPNGASVGLSGCDADNDFQFRSTESNTVAGGTHITVTAAGVDFLLAYKEAITALLFPVDEAGWVRLELDPFMAGSDALGITLRELVVRFNLRTTEINLAFLPDPTRIRVSVNNAQIRIDEGVVVLSVGGDGACRLTNGIDQGESSERFMTTDIVIDVFPTIDEEGRLDLVVEMETAELEELDVELVFDATLPECADGATAVECRVGCGASNLGAELVELVTATFGEQLSQILLPVVNATVNELVSDFTQDPLALEGQVRPQALADVIPLPLDAHPFQFKAGPSAEGFTLRTAGNEGDGMGITLDVGMDAIDHPCVPAVNGEPDFSVGEAPILTGFDHDGRPYQMGASIAEATLNRGLWAGWRAGLFCLTLDSQQIDELVGQRIDTGALGLFLPGLDALTDGPQPIMFAVDPRFSEAAFPLARLKTVEDDGGIPQIGLTVSIPTLSLDLYTVIQSRWTRIFRARVDIELDAVIAANPDNTLGLSLGAPRIDNLEQTYNELLDSDNVPELMNLLVNVATTSLVGDGIEFELGFEGILAELTGLPLEPEILGMRIDGARNDFLSVLTGLRAANPGNGLTAAVDTYAHLVTVSRGQAILDVDAFGTDEALYQWRVDGGPWRPLTYADEGRLSVVDPFLEIPGTHRIMVRAVAQNRYRSLDPDPAILSLIVPAHPEPQTHMEQVPEAILPTSPGCHSGPRDTPAPPLVWATLLLLLTGRRRRIPFFLAVMVIVPLLGCEDRAPANQIRCERDGDCLGGQLCIEGVCAAAQTCGDAGAQCCILEECRGGFCLPLPSDDCAQSGCPANEVCTESGYCNRRPCNDDSVCKDESRCVASHCVPQVPCEGRCAAGEACYVHRDACRPSPASCQPCPEGQVQVVLNPGLFDGPMCNVEAAECECVGARQLNVSGAGTEASMGLVARVPVFAAYDQHFGDLIYVEDPTGESPRVTFVDGIPADAPVDADPNGPRGGVSTPGPNRGRWPDMAVAADGTAHIVYRDADAKSLRYVRRSADGIWTQPIVLDDQGDVGHFPQIELDPENRPHIIHSVAMTVDGLSGVRYLVANNATPAPGDFRSRAVSVRRQPDSPAPEFGGVSTPGRTCLHITNTGRALIGFYRPDTRWLYLARGDMDGFEVEPLSNALRLPTEVDPGGRYLDFGDHDVGSFCGIAGTEEAVQVVFTDHRTWSLLAYRGPFAGDGDLELVDGGGLGSRRRVGADLEVHLDPLARLITVYQDATDNDVRFTIRHAEGWVPAESLATRGAMGFSNSLVVLADEMVVGTVELRTLPGGRLAPRLHVLRIPLPDAPRP